MLLAGADQLLHRYKLGGRRPRRRCSTRCDLSLELELRARHLGLLDRGGKGPQVDGVKTCGSVGQRGQLLEALEPDLIRVKILGIKVRGPERICGPLATIAPPPEQLLVPDHTADATQRAASLTAHTPRVTNAILWRPRRDQRQLVLPRLAERIIDVAHLAPRLPEQARQPNIADIVSARIISSERIIVDRAEALSGAFKLVERAVVPPEQALQDQMQRRQRCDRRDLHPAPDRRMNQRDLHPKRIDPCHPASHSSISNDPGSLRAEPFSGKHAINIAVSVVTTPPHP